MKGYSLQSYYVKYSKHMILHTKPEWISTFSKMITWLYQTIWKFYDTVLVKYRENADTWVYMETSQAIELSLKKKIVSLSLCLWHW